MFPTPDLMEGFVGAFLGHEARQEAWFASSAKRGPKAATEQINRAKPS